MDLTKLEGKPFYGKARIQFLAYRESIAKAIGQGYPLTVIWQTMREDSLFDAKYDQFVRYVNTLIHEKKKRPERLSPKPDLKNSASSQEQSLGQSRRRREDKVETMSKIQNAGTLEPQILGGFKMNPNGPRRAQVGMPKPFEWNPIPLSEEEIRTGKITSR